MSGRAGPRRRPDEAPAALRFASCLLALQACLWSAATLGGVAVVADNAPLNRSHEPWYLLIGGLACLAIAALAVGSGVLSLCLWRGRRGARRTVVGLESCMTALGLLIAYYTASSGAGITAALPVLAGLGGASLSAAAGIGLLCQAARRYTRPRSDDGAPLG